MTDSGRRSARRVWAWAALVPGVILLGVILLLLRFSIVTDYMYHALVKDPERTPPSGNVILAPADGTVIYIRKVTDGIAPQIVKRGVPVPLTTHFKTDSELRLKNGYLIGIYMNTDGVHINRAPTAGRIRDRVVFNGPHMDMSEAERTILLTQLLPGWVSLKKMLGWPPYDIEDEADFVLKSARETLVIEDARGTSVYVVRIADYYVGKILLWVDVGQSVTAGQKIGMITWGSQTDICFEESPGMVVGVEVGDFVYGGETILATY